MSRAVDTFDSPSKDAYRQRNVRLLREASFLVGADGKLVGDWVELVGGSGWRSLELLEREGLVAAGQFVGVDFDAAHIDKYKAERPDMQWVCGNLFTHVSALRQKHRVAVLNVDGYSETGAEDAGPLLTAIRPLIQDGVRRFNEFALFWTTCLDATTRHGKRQAGALRRQAEVVVDVLRGYAPMRALRVEDVLPIGSEAAVEDTGFVGTLGGFDVYVGEGHKQRMAVLRLLL